jgi:ABC-type multidrug transport system permease subunit
VHFLFVSAWKDLQRRLADPAALLLWIGLPIVIGALMSAIGGDDGPAPKARVLLVNEDQTFVSRLVGQAGRSGQLASFLEVEDVATAALAQARMDAGDASALLVVPRGFQDAVLRETPATLTLVTNPAERILPVIIEEGLGMAVEATFYAQRLFGPVIAQLTDSIEGQATGPSDAFVVGVNRSIRESLSAVESTLLPPVLTLETEAVDTSAAANQSFGALFLPGMLFMAILFTAQGMSADVWAEKSQGTLARALTTPAPASTFLAGKVLTAVGIMSTAVVLGLVFGVLLFDVAIERALGGLVWSAFAGAAVFAYLVLLQGLASSARGAQLLTSMIVFPLLMMGGSLFPFESMPEWMVAIGQMTPNGQAVAILKQLLFGTADVGRVAMAALAIGVPAVAAFLLAAKRLGRVARAA